MKFVNQTFNKLCELGQISQSKNTTPFSYSVFCIWKIQNRKQKRPVVVDIRKLNTIIKPDTYFIPI